MKLSDKLAQRDPAKGSRGLVAPPDKAPDDELPAETGGFDDWPEDAFDEPGEVAAPPKSRGLSESAEEGLEEDRPGRTLPTPRGPGRKSKKEEEGDRWMMAKSAARELILSELTPKMTGPDALGPDELRQEITAAADRVLRRDDVSISPGQRKLFIQDIISDIMGYGPIDDLLADSEVDEVMCNAYDDIWVERKGKVVRTNVKFTDNIQYRGVIDRIVSAVGRRVDESSPMVDARLPDGSRVNAIVPPLALKGPVLTIRRFAEDPYTMQDLIGFGTLSDDLGVLLEACVRGKTNILVSGGTATGKTTMLNVLSRFIPEDERIITVEDAAELQLQQPHVVSLESRPANAEGRGEVGIRELVRNTLRMRPDRIVVGECRGAEALDMLQAMNTGHEGSLTTIHANSPRDAIGRLEMLVLMAGMELPEKAVREQITAAIELIVQIQRLPDGSRKVTSVQEIQGMEDRAVLLQEIFKYEPRLDSNGRYVGHAEPTGLRPKFLEKLKQHEITVPAAILRPRPATPRAEAGKK